MTGFPNVPNLPGVPPLARGGGGLPLGASLALSAITGGINAIPSTLLSYLPYLNSDVIGGMAPVLYAAVYGGAEDLKRSLESAAYGAIAKNLGVAPSVVADTVRPILNALIPPQINAATAAFGGDTSPTPSSTIAPASDLYLTENIVYPLKFWGLYTADGDLALEVDSVIETAYSKEFNTPAYPLEGGGFETYNKVEAPYEARLVLTKGGTEDAKRVFIETLEGYNRSLDLFQIVTPDKTYENANIVRLQITRTREQGADLVRAEVGLREIRSTTTTTYTQIDPTVDSGAVQALPPGIYLNPESAAAAAARARPPQ